MEQGAKWCSQYSYIFTFSNLHIFTFSNLQIISLVFHFKQFGLSDDMSAMKIGTDAVLLGSWVEINEESSILDVGTGAGILALMMAQRSEAMIDAVEIDSASAAQAARNITQSPWPERIRLHAISFQDFAKNQIPLYDLIISNPPYFTNSLKPPNTGRSIARHDDSLPVSVFMEGVGKSLSDSGKLAIIIPNEAGNSWTSEASLYNLKPSRMASVIPRQGKSANRLMVEFRKHGTPLKQEEEIIIRDASGRYTDIYKNLTYDFYLGL
jgi:tRNA1Val (adenine37-N6)-methyltransferase